MVTTTSPGAADAATAVGDRREIGQVLHRDADVFGDTRPAHPGDGLFACAVDVEHENLIGRVERRTELSGESLRPRIQMRLEHHQGAAGAGLLQ